MATPATPRQRQYAAAVIAQQHNLHNNLQGTLYNLSANTPLSGNRRRVLDLPRPRPAARLDYLSLNLLGTAMAPPPEALPDGHALLHLPVIRKARAVQPDNFQYPLGLASPEKPAGAAVFLLPVPRLPRQMPFYIQDPRPRQDGTQVFPSGRSTYALPTPAKRRLRLWFQAGFSSSIRGVAAQSYSVHRPAPLLLSDRLDIELLDGGVELLGERDMGVELL